VGDPLLTAGALNVLLGDRWLVRRPRYRALAERVHELIGQGEIERGVRLPPERELAAALGVSRGTIVSAYDALRDADVLQRRQGSGTFVADASRTAPDARVSNVLLSRGRSETAPAVAELISLTIPRTEPLEHLLTEAMLAGAAEVADVAQGLDGLPEGLPTLRSAVAESFTRRGLPTTGAQIRITDGPRSALELALEHVVEPGGRVLVESPTSDATLETLRAWKLRLVSVPADRAPAGDELGAAVRRARPDAMLLMPSCHPIVGRVASAVEREAIGRLSAGEDLPLIDDDAWAGLTLDDDPAPPLAAFAPGPRVVTIGSAGGWFSGVELAWIRYAEPLVAEAGRFTPRRGPGTSVVTQIVVNQLLRNHELVEHHRRQEMADRLELAVGLLGEELPDWSWQYPRGGRSLWLQMPRGDAAELARVALGHGVAVLPGSLFSAEGAHRDRVRIFFVQPQELLVSGLRRLGRAWAEYARAARGAAIRSRTSRGVRSA
jgi:DNA-binding transcriptional MocR family regulator